MTLHIIILSAPNAQHQGGYQELTWAITDAWITEAWAHWTGDNPVDAMFEAWLTQLRRVVPGARVFAKFDEGPKAGEWQEW